MTRRPALVTSEGKARNDAECFPLYFSTCFQVLFSTVPCVPIVVKGADSTEVSDEHEAELGRLL